MGVVSRPANNRSRTGHAAVYGPDHGHVNAACCECPRCEARRFTARTLRMMAEQTYNDPPEPTHFSGIEPRYRIAVDLGNGGDRYTVHSVRRK